MVLSVEWKLFLAYFNMLDIKERGEWSLISGPYLPAFPKTIMCLSGESFSSLLF
jgi:hypothetical protein